MKSNIIDVVLRGNKWGIIRRGNKRASTLYYTRLYAYLGACRMKSVRVVFLHNEDGSLALVTELENSEPCYF